jgi:thiol-disulfide isomerase/thioredoxin
MKPAVPLALLVFGGCHPGVPESRGAGAAAIAWIQDDYAAARKRAADERKPLVIDMWAPWCHTCLSMKHFVLSDPGIGALADRFVWLAVDTDRAANATAVGRYAVSAWPTFFVVSPESEAIESRLVGSATVREFRDFLERGERGFRETRGGILEAPLRHVRDGDRAAAARDWAAADRAYGEALAGDLGPRLPDVLVAAIGVRAKAGDWAGCVRLGIERLADSSRGHSAKTADFADYANMCAEKLGDAQARRLREAIVAKDGPVRAVIMDPAAPLSVDDRSDGLRILREVHDALGQKEAADALAERERALVEGAIAEAPDPRTAMTFNWPLAEVCVRLHKPDEAIAILRRSADALPDEYDPPYRLAWVLLQSGRAADALPPAEQALGLVYGPRKARVQGLIADIHKARGDVVAERDARAAVVAIWEALPPGQYDAQALFEARAALAKVGR